MITGSCLYGGIRFEVDGLPCYAEFAPSVE